MGENRQLRSTATFGVAIAVSLPLLAGFFGSLHPALDAFAHFRIHLAIVLIMLSALLVLGSFRRQGLVAMAFGLSAIAGVMGWGLPPHPGAVHAAFRPKPEAGPTYRLLQLNLRLDNWEPGNILALIGRVQPDVVTLEEFSADWANGLAGLRTSYPHQILCYQAANDGVAILSRHAFGNGRKASCLQDDAMAIAAVDFDGRPVDIAALHLLWPWPFDQSRQIDALREPLGGLAATAILSGDLNAVSWSAAASRVRSAGGFAQIVPIGPTWLYYRLPDWLRFAGLPIDQVMTKGDAVVHSARRLEPAGSDHLPVLVEFSLNATAD